MRILRHTDPDFADTVARLDRFFGPDPAVEAIVFEILEAVRRKGDKAVLKYAVKFGGPKLRPEELLVTPEEKTRARAVLTPAVCKALEASHRNVCQFATRSLRKSWAAKNRQGATVGERYDPFQRVGIYVPGGTAPLVSSAIMTVALAATAGVPEIVVTTPPTESGELNDALLGALDYAGATEVYKVGGAQAVAAMAYGTETIKPVAKIFGPGNAYVVEAKRQVFGRVAVDLLPGPSEIMVIADATARPDWIASDLLAQAEHGKGSRIIFLTNSRRILEGVQSAVESQLKSLNRLKHLRPVLKKNTFLIQVKSLADAVDLANDFSPEHLSVVARNEEKLAEQVRSAGAIFVGGWSPVAGGDFMAGPSHELPTGGAGKSFPGLTVDQFQRRTSVVRFDRESLRKSARTIETFSEIEGLDAHGRSVAVRLEGLDGG